MKLIPALTFLLLLPVTDCRSLPVSSVDPPDGVARQLEDARSWSRLGERRKSDTQAWLNCDKLAYRALGARQREIGVEAAALATHCPHEFLALAIGNPAHPLDGGRDTNWPC